MNTPLHYLGVDIADQTFAATQYSAAEQKYSKPQTFPNDPPGFNELESWFKKRGADPSNTVVCMEATGVYAERLCYWLCAKGYRVVVEAPHKTKRAFHPLGAKSDPIDSRQIAEYAWRFFDQLSFWKPSDELIEQVRVLLTTREQMTRQMTANQNALSAISRKVVRIILAEQSFLDTIRHLKEQIKKIDAALEQLISKHPTIGPTITLLLTVPGVGRLLAAHLMVMSQGFTQTLEPRRIASYLGMCPLEYSSGSSVRKNASSRGIGPDIMRKLLHLAARSLRTHHHQFRHYFEQKVQAGKANRLALNNIANKLLRIVCAVLRTRTPYIPGYRSVNPRVLQNA